MVIALSGVQTDREAGVRFVITSLISDQNCTLLSAIAIIYYIYFEIYKRERWFVHKKHARTWGKGKTRTRTDGREGKTRI